MIRTIANLLLIILFPILSLSAQEPSTIFTSEDSALSFEISSEWVLEERRVTFGENYFYEFYNSERSDFSETTLGRSLESRIVFEVDMLDNTNQTPSDYLFELVDTTTVNIEDIEFDGLPAAISTIPLPSGSDDYYTYIIVIFREDNWAVIASLVAPLDQKEQTVAEFDNLLETYVLDTTVASTPFEREIEIYEISDIELDEEYEIPETFLRFNYPADWEFTDVSSIVGVYYSAVLSSLDESSEINIYVTDLSVSYLNVPFARNTPEKYMYQLRFGGIPDIDYIEEYKVDDYEVIIAYHSESISLNVALDDTWLLQVIAGSPETSDEPEYLDILMAIVASLEFDLGQSVIMTSFFNVHFSEDWLYQLAIVDEGYYYYILGLVDELEAQETYASIEIISPSLSGFSLDRILENPEFSLNSQETITINDYQIEHIVYEQSNGRSGEFYVITVNEDWIAIVSSYAITVDGFEQSSDFIASIIEDIEFTFEEE